jgi:hypothetical protein
LKDLYYTDKGKRVILTLMSLTRGIEPTKTERLSIKPDFSSITDESKGRTYVIPRFFIDVMKRKYGITGKVVEPSGKNFFINLKGSSVGRVSIFAVVTAALVLTKSRGIEYLFTLLGGGVHYFCDAYNLGIRSPIYRATSEVLPGKLSIVHDPEGKERVIAMLDYWTQ